MSEIILYSTGCPKCTVLKEKLDAVGITYTVENDTDKMLRLGIQHVPMLCAEGNLMDFAEAIEWIGGCCQ